MIRVLVLSLVMVLAIPVSGTNAQLAYYRQLFERYGRQYGIDPLLLEAIGRTESDLDPSMTGAAGEYGMMQILPSTARAMGLRREVAYDPEQNIKFAALFLSQNMAIIDSRRPHLSRRRRSSLLIASYNSGVGGALSGHFRNSYVKTVTRHWLSLGGNPATPEYNNMGASVLAEIWLNDIVVEDASTDSGRFLDLTFNAKFDPQITGATLILHIGCEKNGPWADKRVKVAGIPEGTGNFSFQARVCVEADFRACWADARIELQTPQGMMSWPWFGIVDQDGYPVDRFPF